MSKKIPWNFLEIPWNFLKIPWNFLKIPWDFLEIPWNFGKFHGNSTNSIVRSLFDLPHTVFCKNFNLNCVHDFLSFACDEVVKNIHGKYHNHSLVRTILSRVSILCVSQYAQKHLIMDFAELNILTRNARESAPHYS